MILKILWILWDYICVDKGDFKVKKKIYIFTYIIYMQGKADLYNDSPIVSYLCYCPGLFSKKFKYNWHTILY